MDLELLLDHYQRYLVLMDRGAQAVERQDLLTLEDLAQESAVLLAQIRLAWSEVEENPSRLEGNERVERLRRMMEEALARSEQNQRLVARWMEETQESLRTAMKGSTAMAGYAGLVRQGERLVNAQI